MAECHFSFPPFNLLLVGDVIFKPDLPLFFKNMEYFWRSVERPQGSEIPPICVILHRSKGNFCTEFPYISALYFFSPMVPMDESSMVCLW